ncbi:hypothetical protein V3C99_015734, partial [Haemonchus contortus]
MAIMTYLTSSDNELAEEMARNLYVDNILLSASTVEEALSKYKKSKVLFARIGMNLREYVSNNNAVNEAIPVEDRSPNGKIKFLGVPYDTRSDEFSVELSICIKERPTKRDIVSQLNSIYDPLGLAAPLLIKLKHLMREIFECNLDWKDQIPPNLSRQWVRACNDINNTTMSIPRTLNVTASGTLSYSLWTFCDASELAMATCAYLRSDNTLSVSSLISGKTKLAPKRKKQTIPKLELLAILMGTRLSTNISESTEYVKEVNIIADSKVALAWVKTARKLPLFVSNQKERITKLVNQIRVKNINVNFYYVPTTENPADAGTRGLSTEKMSTHSWIRGPKWLTESQNKWPLVSINGITEEIIENVIKEVSTATVEIEETSDIKKPTKIIDLKRFSQLNKALRTMARVGKGLKRWISRTNNHRSTSIKTELINQFSFERKTSASDISL